MPSTLTNFWKNRSNPKGIESALWELAKSKIETSGNNRRKQLESLLNWCPGTDELLTTLKEPLDISVLLKIEEEAGNLCHWDTMEESTQADDLGDCSFDEMILDHKSAHIDNEDTLHDDMLLAQETLNNIEGGEDKDSWGLVLFSGSEEHPEDDEMLL